MFFRTLHRHHRLCQRRNTRYPLYLTRFPSNRPVPLSLFFSSFFLFSFLLFSSTYFPIFHDESARDRPSPSDFSFSPSISKGEAISSRKTFPRIPKRVEARSSGRECLYDSPPPPVPVSYRFRWRRRASTWMETHNPDICRFSGNKTRRYGIEPRPPPPKTERCTVPIKKRPSEIRIPSRPIPFGEETFAFLPFSFFFLPFPFFLSFFVC